MNGSDRLSYGKVLGSLVPFMRGQPPRSSSYNERPGSEHCREDGPVQLSNSGIISVRGRRGRNGRNFSSGKTSCDRRRMIWNRRRCDEITRVYPENLISEHGERVSLPSFRHFSASPRHISISRKERPLSLATLLLHYTFYTERDCI